MCDAVVLHAGFPSPCIVLQRAMHACWLHVGVCCGEVVCMCCEADDYCYCVAACTDLRLTCVCVLPIGLETTGFQPSLMIAVASTPNAARHVCQCCITLMMLEVTLASLRFDL